MRVMLMVVVHRGLVMVMVGIRWRWRRRRTARHRRRGRRRCVRHRWDLEFVVRIAVAGHVRMHVMVVVVVRAVVAGLCTARVRGELRWGGRS